MSTQQPRVLVVEDEESLHALLQYNLEKEGFSVDVAVDGEEALMMIDERAPDIVILDCQIMPAEPARLVGLLKRMAPGSCIVALVPAADSMAGAAARALGADAIGVLAELPALLNGLTAADAV